MNTMPIHADNSAAIISARGVNKTYASGFQALKNINLDIKRGEIFALLGPNGAGKTTLISIICGIVKASSGTIIADGYDIVRDYRAARATIGLVPQELHTDSFESVWATVKFSRGLFGRAPNAAHLEKVLREYRLLNLYGWATFSGNVTGNERELLPDLIYFSFVTLASLGYGDISPIGGLTKTLAYLEAVVGQFYLAVMVATLVGVYSAGRKRE